MKNRGAKGDAIKFVQLIEKVGFTDALKILARKFKVDVPEEHFSGNGGNGHSEEKKLVDKMRMEAVRQYAGYLFSDEGREALEYLKSRGFTEETLRKYNVGYVPTKTTTEGFLYTKKYAQSEIVSSGLLAKDGEEYVDRFHHRLVFPNIVHERVVHVTGRAIGKMQPKYMHLPGEIKFLYNEAALASKDVVITEGIPDCLTLLQMGFPAVAVYGAKTFKKEWVEKFKQCEKVYVFLDNDAAGKSAALQVAEMLKDKARIVSLPEFQGKDINEYFVSGATKKDLERQIENAKTLMEYKISSVPADTEKAKLFEALKPLLHELSELDEIESQNVLLYMLKPHFLLTHQETKLYQKKIKNLRKQITKEKQEVEGPVCFIETTTRPHIHAENETRCFDVFVDESKEQTKKIFSVQDVKYLPHVEMSQEAQGGIARKHKNGQRMLKSIPVVIPYIKHIHFPVEPLRVRRDRGRFLSMIEASAFWHQEQRERKMLGGKEYIVADFSDYTIAYRLASKVLAQALKEVTPKAEKLMKWRGNVQPTDFVFADRNGQRMKMRRVAKIVEDCGKKAGIEKAHCHRFRHTFALSWIKYGGDTFSLQRILGHTTLDMVRNYVNLAGEDVVAKHRQFGLMDRMEVVRKTKKA